jgi:hypothetical protein
MSTYEKRPLHRVGTADAVLSCLPGGRITVVECYPGVRARDIVPWLDADLVVDVSVAHRCAEQWSALVAEELTDDPVFGRLSSRTLLDIFDPSALQRLQLLVREAPGTVALHGVGAALVTEADVLVYADLARWEVQQRQRRGELGNLCTDNAGARPAELYRRAFFLDWRLADRHKATLLERVDAFLDTTAAPVVAAGAAVREGLRSLAHQPFRLVPFFDPAPWGGRWMREVFDLPEGPANYGWCFDCVPEENSLLLGFGEHVLELPALDLVLLHPRELLGERVERVYGAEFPIRFDFLDTMGGGNLSLQVHPPASQIRQEFGWGYTQDESYYLLDATPDATVYLGLRPGVEPADLLAAAGGPHFEASEFVNVLPVRKHDHVLIPAGTVHCSGAGSMVLEISATPFVFTFKLWDWDRPGLDGLPRPLNLERGRAALRDTGDDLVNVITPLDKGEGWRSERTGLHAAEPLETHRHWFSVPVRHETFGSVNVLNLVEGEQVTVSSPTGAFAPYVVHYAETFVVPASVRTYEISPPVGQQCVTIKAFVR